MANCIVPDCHCTHYEQSTQDKGRILAYRPDCGGCGHKKALHRLPTGSDTLIMRELSAADSIPCCSLIPMSELPSMTHFRSHDLIPIPPDEIDTQALCNVLCLCQGFHTVGGNMASILFNYTRSSVDDVHRSLPSVQCARCTHPLLNHQRTHPSHFLCDQRVLSLKTSVSVEGLLLPLPRLIKFMVNENRLALVALVQKNSSYQLIFQDQAVPVFKEDKTIRRSFRLAASKTSHQEEESVSSLTTQLTEFLNKALTTPMSLNEELFELEVTCLACAWHASSDQLVVAIGTARDGVIVCVPGSAVSKIDRRLTNSSSVTVLQYCCTDALSHSLVLCVGSHSGSLQCWNMDDGVLLAECCKELSSITDLLWIQSKRYIVCGTEDGHISLYSLTASGNNTRQLVFCHKLQTCSAPCTCLYWLHENQCILVGSADNNIHILTVKSSIPDQSKHSILNYFNPLREDSERLKYCGVMKGHQSFVSSIISYRGNILSIGWDGYAIIWLLEEVDRAMGGAEPADVEPNLLYKLGIQEYLVLLPCDMWSVGDRAVLVGYQGMNKELSLAIY